MRCGNMEFISEKLLLLYLMLKAKLEVEEVKL